MYGAPVDVLIPTPVTALAGIAWAAVSVGQETTCGLSLNGTIYCFGMSSRRRAGN